MNLKDPSTISLFDELLREDPEVEVRRKDLKSKIGTLGEVLAGMRDVGLSEEDFPFPSSLHCVS